MNPPPPPLQDGQPGSPGVLIHPPILVAIALLSGIVLEAVLPLGLGLASGRASAILPGLAIFALGAWFMGRAFGWFRRAGTNVPTYKPALKLVTDGPYRITRNPIYVGGLTAFVGLGFLLSSPWVVLMTMPVALILHFGVVKREEAYLEQRFGEPYRAYCRQAPRWLGF